jgi:hypothetical protein
MLPLLQDLFFLMEVSGVAHNPWAPRAGPSSKLIQGVPQTIRSLVTRPHDSSRGGP